MAQKMVTGVDGRLWYVTSKIMWSERTEGFEHEKEGGRNAAIIIISIMGLLVFGLIAWGFSVPSVEVPWWMFVILAVGVLFFPTRWALRRRWLIRAEGGRWSEDDDAGGEAWGGFVRGRTEAKAEVRQIVRSLQKRGTPARANSPLQPQ
ncbi:hypothetical protein [Actinomycetospora sp. NBRC 106378]|jgi:hypothetical protein|uniref:hypothetical protein n=1 Tax=Actinomycetospora sp. NBRC 106378 TaxID=3032208 RepID=UPI0024A4F9B1|nr:hypothetical protein [Actinomycetospora sp. NBRC 106378]GLZ56179.1 hypothetical protein Acsp07_57960 [Actinomycetospora sp. NBRC 106378]